MSKAYGTTKCYDNINTVKAFVDTVVNNYIAKIPVDAVNRTQLIAFAEAVRSINKKTYTINGKTVEYVLKSLSCNDYCTLNNDANYDSATKQCVCKTSGYNPKEIDNIYNINGTNVTIPAAKCLSSLEIFNETLKNTTDILNRYITNINKDVIEIKYN